MSFIKQGKTVHRVGNKIIRDNGVEIGTVIFDSLWRTERFVPKPKHTFDRQDLKEIADLIVTEK